MRRALPPTPLVVDGRTFVAWTRKPHDNVTLHNLTEDDVNWALSHLGQYVRGHQPYAVFRAYVAEVTAGLSDTPAECHLIMEDVMRRA